MTVGKVADSIKYSRVHLTREMKKEEKSDLEDLLIQKHSKLFQNDSSDSLHLTGELEQIIGDLKEKAIRLEAQATVTIVSLAQVLSNQTGRAIGSVSVELSKAIDEEVNRILREQKKKG